ncbi:MAG: rRNA maturation RNase YbeY [Gammaproteobacteria bacterium]
MNGSVRVAVQIATGDDEVPPGAAWQTWVDAALAAARADRRRFGCVTLRLVGRRESRHLNEAYRNGAGPTNVLAFAGPGDESPADDDRELGDIVVCLPVAQDEAEAQGKAPVAHLAHLVVHGTLHLVGFDHEHDAEAARMEALETRVMLDLGFAAPYASEDNGRVADTGSGE